MPYLWLPFFFVLLILTLFIGYALILTWRRLRGLEQRLQSLDQQGLQGELLLSEYLAEIERAADRALQRVQASREPAQVEPMAQEPSNQTPAAEPPPEAERTDPQSSRALMLKIHRLASEGHSPTQIAKQLHMGVGEVELVLGLGRLLPPQ